MQPCPIERCHILPTCGTWVDVDDSGEGCEERPGANEQSKVEIILCMCTGGGKDDKRNLRRLWPGLVLTLHSTSLCRLLTLSHGRGVAEQVRVELLEPRAQRSVRRVDGNDHQGVDQFGFLS